MKQTLHLTLVVFALIFVFKSENSQAQERRNTHEFSLGQVVSSSTGRISDGTLHPSKEEGDFYVVGIWQGIEGNRTGDLILTSGVVSCLKSQGEILKKGQAVCSDGNGRVKRASDDKFVIGYVVQDSDKSSELVDVRLNL